LSDNELLFQIAQKKESAFREFYGLYADKVFNMALIYSKNQQDAEEITQDVFSKIFHSADKFKGESSVSTWVYRITVNHSLNYIKKRKRGFSFNLSGEKLEHSDFVHPGILMENKEQSSLLFQVIETLPESQKTAFILSFIEELPRAEVAQIMEVSLKAVESLLQRGKESLRKKLLFYHPDRRKTKK
jgi:RNA polymerase sigma factor (sigma-70 family)